jgi:hypothetical protein
MTISRHHVAALHAALTGDADAFDRIDREIGLGDGRDFPALLTTAFIAASHLRFASRWSIADVIKFVSQVRIRDGDRAPISPTLAEQMILSALHDTPFSVPTDATATAYTQFILMRRLVSDLGGERLSLLLAQAQVSANQWIAEQAST